MLVFDYITDEALEIRWNEDILILTDHDQDGWSGMSRIRDAMQDLAEAAGIEYRIQGEPNV